MPGSPIWPRSACQRFEVLDGRRGDLDDAVGLLARAHAIWEVLRVHGRTVFVFLLIDQFQVAGAGLRPRLRAQAWIAVDTVTLAVACSGPCRSRFRADGDHDSGLMPITFRQIPEWRSASPEWIH
jgi:hypothetical protein